LIISKYLLIGGIEDCGHDTEFEYFETIEELENAINKYLQSELYKVHAVIKVAEILELEEVKSSIVMRIKR
jgi:uncharacterized protein (DUF302 family)